MTVDAHGWEERIARSLATKLKDEWAPAAIVEVLLQPGSLQVCPVDQHTLSVRVDKLDKFKQRIRSSAAIPPDGVNIVAICIALLRVSSAHNIVRFIARNTSNRAAAEVIRRVVSLHGARFARPPVWHLLLQVQRADLVLFVVAALNCLLAVNDSVEAFRQLTSLLVAETVISVDTHQGREMAHRIHGVCHRAAIAAKIVVDGGPVITESNVVLMSKKPVATGPMFSCIIFKRGEIYHTLFLREYDLLFVWLALLFDATAGPLWETRASDWPEIDTLRGVLEWKEMHAARPAPR